MATRRALLFGSAASLAVPFLPNSAWAAGGQNTDWRYYAGDLANTRYSPLDQINAANFNSLEVAWRFKTDSLGNRPEYNYEATPLVKTALAARLK